MCRIAGYEFMTVFGLGFDHLFSTTTPQGPRYRCQSPGTVADPPSITSASPQQISLRGYSLPAPCEVAGPFPRNRGAWVSLPVAWCNGRPPLPTPRHLSSFPHPPLPSGPTYTHDWHLQTPAVSCVCTPAYVNTPQRVCHSCLDT